MKKNLQTYADILPCIPVGNFDFETESDTGRIIVLRPKYISKWAEKFVMPLLKQKYFRVKLDELGSLVWKYCDGNNSVQELIGILQEHYGESQEQLAERLVKFIMHLQKQKFITLNCPVSE